MAATGSNCSGFVSVLKVREAFLCPSCGAELGTPAYAPFLAVFVLWSIADLVLMVLVRLAAEP